MACNDVIDIPLDDCGNNNGGMPEFKYWDMNDVTGYTYSTSTWEVTGLTLSTTASVIGLRKNTSNFTEESPRDLINGSTFYRYTVNLILHRRDAAKSRAINIAGEGQRYLGVAVKDANNICWYFPNSQISAVGDGSGTARADGSKYSVTLIAEMNDEAFVIPNAIFDGL